MTTKNLKYRISHRVWRIALWADRIDFEQRAEKIGTAAILGAAVFFAGYFAAIYQLTS